MGETDSVQRSSGGTGTSCSTGNCLGEGVMGKGDPGKERHIRELIRRRDAAQKYVDDHPGLLHSIDRSYNQETVDNLNSRIADLQSGQSRGIGGTLNDFVTDTGDSVVGGVSALGGAVYDRGKAEVSDLATGDPATIAGGYVSRGVGDVKAVGGMIGDAYSTVTHPSGWFQSERDAFAAGDYGNLGSQGVGDLAAVWGATGAAKALAGRVAELVAKKALTAEELAALRKMSEKDAEAAVKKKEADAAAKEQIERDEAAAREEGEVCEKCSGKPVRLRDGAKITFDHEFHLPGPLPIDLERSFASDLGIDGPLGRNRIGSLDERLVAEADGALRYRMGSGLSAVFDRPGVSPGGVSRNAKHRHLDLSAAPRRAFVIDALNLRKRFEKFPDGVWHLVEIHDRNAHRATLQRSADGLLLSLRRSDGFALLFDNDEQGRRRAVTMQAPDGSTRRLLDYAYDARGNLTEARNGYGRSFHYDYDAADRLIAFDDGRRTRNSYRYDGSGRVAAVGTRSTVFDYAIEYDPARRETAIVPTHRPQARVVYGLDEHGKAVSETNGLGHTLRYEYDPAGALTAMVDGEGNRVEYAYDQHGFLKSARDAEGRTTLLVRNRLGELQIAVDGAGNSWDLGYDERGNTAWIEDPLGHRTEYVNDAAGFPVRIMRADGLMQSRAYDAQHRLTDIVDFRGARTRYEYDSFGRLVRATNALGAVTAFAYGEPAGQEFWKPTSVVRPDGVTVSRTYDEAGSCVVTTDGEGRRTTYRYGTFDLIESIVGPDGNAMRFEYDHDERLVAVVKAGGLRWAFERDAAGRILSETDFNGIEIRYDYDRADRPVRASYADGTRIDYAYDRSGLRIRADATTPDAAASIVHYEYDRRGELVSARNDRTVLLFERDAMGRVVGESSNGRKAVSVFDCCGNRVERTIGLRIVRCSFDPLGAVSEMVVGAFPALRFGRDALGRELTRKGEAGFDLRQSYDEVGQLLRQASAGPAFEERQAGFERSYSWDKAFTPASVADSLWGTTRYDVSAAGKVVAARFGDGTGERFDYDASSNLAAYSDDGGAAAPWLAAVGGRVRAARAADGSRILLAYDERGNVAERRVERDGFRPKVWRYGWDAHARLARCEAPDGSRWRYSYDPLGRRTEKVRVLADEELAWVAQRHADLRKPRAASQATLAAARRPPGADEAGVLQPVVGTAYFWDGDTVAEEGKLRLDGSVDWDGSVGWHYEPGTMRPLARETAGALALVVTDHLGRPARLFDGRGAPLLAVDYRTWGDVRSLWVAGSREDSPGDVAGGEAGGRTFGSLALREEPDAIEARGLCPLRSIGQWDDAETGLFYNRHRHYDPAVAQYATPDPIGIHGGSRTHGYVANPLLEIDPFGLAASGSTVLRGNLVSGGCVSSGIAAVPWQAQHNIPQQVWDGNQSFFNNIGMGVTNGKNPRDAAANGTALPAKEADGLKLGLCCHRGSHPNYSADVAKRLGTIRDQFNSGAIDAAQARSAVGNLQSALGQEMMAMPAGCRVN